MSSRQRSFFSAALIIFGVGGRLLLKDLPNIETLTVVSLLAGSLLSGSWTFVVGLASVMISDFVLGNTMIFLYTWSAWALMGVFGWVLRRRPKRVFWHSLELTGAGIFGNIFFYIWTNFGVWHIGGLYSHTARGLAMSYLMGLPFLRLQLLSTLVIVPLVAAPSLVLWNAMVAATTRRKSIAQRHSVTYERHS